MDVTMLYNGPHVQRRKMFTLSPRNNLMSQVQIDWRDSLHHEQLSPLSKIKRKQSIQSKEVAERHNSFIDSYLSTNLNMTDSSIRRYKAVGRASSNVGTYSQNFSIKKQNQEGLGQMLNSCEQNGFKLPKISREQSFKQKDLFTNFINSKPNNYLSRMLRQKLKRYQREGQV